jgi:hypothetical protein
VLCLSKVFTVAFVLLFLPCLLAQLAWNSARDLQLLGPSTTPVLA